MVQTNVTFSMPTTIDAFLVRPDMLEPFGAVEPVVPIQPVEGGLPPTLAELEEGFTTALSVASPKPGDYAATILSTVYRLPTADAAQKAFEESIAKLETMYPTPPVEAPDLLEESIVRALDAGNVNWRAVYGTDEEGLLNYIVMLQLDEVVYSLGMTTFASTFAQNSASQSALMAYLRGMRGAMQSNPTLASVMDEERAQEVSRQMINHLLKMLFMRDEVHRFSPTTTDF